DARGHRHLGLPAGYHPHLRPASDRSAGPDPPRPMSAPAGRTTVFTNAHVVTMDDAGTEHAGGWLRVDQGRVQAVGGGRPPAADETVDLGGAVLTPGLVNVHHHIYQNLTRTRGQEANLLEWLQVLLPVWAGLDAEAEYAAARAGLAELALSGCTTVFD